MRFVQYGNPGSKTVIFLHGGGLSTWNFRDEAEILRGRFHVLIPVLDGHHGSDQKFTSIEENAARIIRYIDSRFQGQVFLIAGLSLGGQVLLEMLSQRNNICEFAIIESTLALPTNATAMLVKPVFSLCYPIVKKRWYAKLQCKALHIRDSLFEDYFRESSQIKKDDMIAFLKANAAYTVKDSLSHCCAKTLILVGGKEREIMKKSAKLLRETIPGAVLEEIPGYYHGDFSLNHPQEFSYKLLDWISDRTQ